MPPMSDLRHGLIRLRAPLPPDIDRKLGYCGDARLVLFFCESWHDAVGWDDGRSHGFGRAGLDAFMQTIVPMADFYQVDLYGGTAMATQVLLFDRLTHESFFAPRAQAELLIAVCRQFLAEAGSTPVAGTNSENYASARQGHFV